MKKILVAMLGVMIMANMTFAESKPVIVSDLALQGEIEGENIVFTLTFNADVNEKNAVIPLVVGDVAYLDGKLPRNTELVRNGSQYALKFKSAGGFWGSSKQNVTFKFASRALKESDWRKTSFSIPSANIRKLSVLCDRDDLKIQFPGALNVERTKVKKDKIEKTQVTAYLGISGTFQVRWKPEVKRLDSDLVVSCDANTIASASVGALRLDTIFTYRIIQGSLSKLELALPDVNVTQVTGEDIQDWTIDKTDKGNHKLIVTLGRPHESIYRLKVESEMILQKFPSSFDLPLIAPEKVIRTSGFLLIGTDSAIKMQVNKAAGLTQVDQVSFPAIAMGKETRVRPNRSTYAYQYANMPYTLAINADDIVTSFSADNNLVLSLTDNELTFDASVEIDVKDAPAREIRIETDLDTEWTVTSITGKQVSEADTDVREEDGKRIIYIPFKNAVRGTALVNVRMERTLKSSVNSFKTPSFKVLGARSERGYLVVAAEKGVQLTTDGQPDGLQLVHTGSAPINVPNAQEAFRFKQSGWKVGLKIERTVSALYSEVFHLVSLGEGVMYNSAAITYHIDGAPIQEFKVKVPKEIETVEFTGADIEGWTREGEVCTVKLHTKVLGDYNLLATYNKQFIYKGDHIAIGGIETIDTESEIGYVALVSSLSLKLTEAKTLTKIERDEIPAEYAASLVDPIIGSYKYVKKPHTDSIKVEPYETDQLLGQVADYVKLKTIISRDGESKTTVNYFIKNTSGQYLTIALPKGVDTVYSIDLITNDGTRERVPSQKNENGDLLVPVKRPRDPDTPILVEIVFAQNHGELGFWRSGVKGLKLEAPSLPKTHATVTSWNVEVKTEEPDKYVLVYGKPGKRSAKGFSGVVYKAIRTGLALLDGPGGQRTIKYTWNYGLSGQDSMEQTRTVNLAGVNPMRMNVHIVPTWVGGSGSASRMVLYSFIGILMLASRIIFKKNPAISALGWALLAFGLAQSVMGANYLSIIFIILAIVVFAMIRGFKIAWLLLKALIVSGPAAFFKAIGNSRRKRKERKTAMKEELASLITDDTMPFEEDTQEEESPFEEDDKSGSASTKLMLFILTLGMLCGTVMAKPVVNQKRIQAPIIKPPVIDIMNVVIDGPKTDKDTEQSANITTTLEFEAEEPASFIVVPSIGVLKDYELNSRNLEIVSTRSGYLLKVDEKGKYKITLKYQSPVIQNKEGDWALAIMMLENMKNLVTLKIPEADMDIKSEEAVLFKTSNTKGVTEAEAVFGPVAVANFKWRPRIRKTSLEEAVFFCEVNTFAALNSGVVDMSNIVRYQIAQGEVKELKLHIPEGMSVTAVKAANLATWSYDPETRMLEAILEKAVSGELILTVTTQIARDGLPYTAQIGVPQISDASRQRGSLALAAPDIVQVKVDEKSIKGLHQMNIEDFSGHKPVLLRKKGSIKPSLSIRRAFRYNQATEASVSVSTERVLSEIRVEEIGGLDISDERIKLATRLSLAIAKSGIFSVTLETPEGFDVETLTGKDVSHWDEVTEAGKENSVVVHFNRQVADQTEINLVVARMERGIEESINVPRIAVRDARKHKGRFTISGERGVRMMIENHRGVDIKKASEVGITQAGTLVFEILRPTWSIDLKTEVLKPLVKPEVLQLVDLSEGMLQCTSYIQYKIENAGVKTFKLQAPKKGVKLSVTGANVARVTEIDKEKALWQIDMHNKVEKQYITVKYQIPIIPEEKSADIIPLRTVDTDTQRGYLAVTCKGRVQITARDKNGLKVENPRNIPSSFKAGDLSNAILCFRTVRPDYNLNLSVIRHDPANVLPAHIKKVSMTSVASSGGTILTQVKLNMTVGNMRLLRIHLPNKRDNLWTVKVNNKEASTSRDGDIYLVPLEEMEGQQESTVDLIYAGRATTFLGKRYNFNAPKFGYSDKLLPLDKIDWTFYVDPAYEYYGFDGSMRHREDVEEQVSYLNANGYLSKNWAKRKENIEKAKEAMEQGVQMIKAGNQHGGQKKFEQALVLSQGQADLNEDARVQLRNSKVQQAKMGLLNRRNVVRFNANVIDEEQIQQIEDFQGGNFTQQYANDIEGNLSSKDNDALTLVANKMLDQQTAAEASVTAINVIMPEHGKALKFFRTMSTKPETDLNISFKRSSGRMKSVTEEIMGIIAVFAGLWILSFTGRKKATVEA